MGNPANLHRIYGGAFRYHRIPAGGICNGCVFHVPATADSDGWEFCKAFDNRRLSYPERKTATCSQRKEEG
jgi:hypothetical protein